MFPEVLPPLQQEFKFWHDKLSLLHPKSMFRLSKLGVSPSIFLDLNYDEPLCSSLMFVTSRRRQCITKGNKSRSISKDTDNKPGDGFSVYQLQSSQTVLVPQLSWKLTSAWIWAVQVLVNHFSDLTYVHLMISTSQKDILAVKSAFERWAEHFGVKIKIYHADNVRFSEHPFIQAIEDNILWG